VYNDVIFGMVCIVCAQNLLPREELQKKGTPLKREALQERRAMIEVVVERDVYTI